MRAVLNDSQPIFQQIAEIIMDEIIEGELKEEEQIPSENDLSQFYGINRATVRKGLQLLTDLDLVYKKRGIGMFVKSGAKSLLVHERQKRYLDEFIIPLLKEAKRIGLETNSVIQMIKEEENK